MGLLQHGGLMFLVNLAKYIVNLMVVCLLIHWMPVISVNIQALTYIFKLEWYFKSPKLTIHLSPLGGLPLLPECPMSRNCSFGSFHVRLFLFIPATCLLFSYFLAMLSLPWALHRYAIPSLEPSPHLSHWIAPAVLQVSALNLLKSPNVLRS